MRIRSSFLLFVAVIGVIVLAFAGVVFRDAYDNRDSAVAARGLAGIQGELLRLVELIGIERGLENSALINAQTASAPSAAIARARGNTDTAFAAALRLARQ